MAEYEMYLNDLKILVFAILDSNDLKYIKWTVGLRVTIVQIMEIVS